MSATTLIIARHGNTFGLGDTPIRVGAHTDLDLVESGLEQGRMIGQYLNENDRVPDVLFSGALKRSRHTAERTCEEMGIDNERIIVEELFNEIDYGPDENKTEDIVIARIRQEAIDLWNDKAVVPDGWKVDPESLIGKWQNFAERCEKDFPGQVILAVTSNGIARFAPYLTGDFGAFTKEHKINISTGALCFFNKIKGEDSWTCDSWNLRPKDYI